MQLENKTVFITGGASGLGEATARRFVGRGANVAILDLDQERGAQLARELGERALFFCVDIRDSDTVNAAISATCRQFGTIHILCNYAGITGINRTLAKEGEPGSMEDFSRIFDVNVLGSYNVVRLVAAQISKNEPQTACGCRGVIINTASIAGSHGKSQSTAYSTSKAAIDALTLPLARDLASHGIRVNAIAPGIIDTPMFGGLSDNLRQSYEQTMLFPKRLGQADEIAHVAEFIVENDYMNAQVIGLDAGTRPSEP